MKFRICGFVLDIHPKNLADAVKLFDEKTGELINIEDIDTSNIGNRQLRPIYLMRLLWKDESTINSEDVLATYIFTYDDNPCHIFPRVRIQGCNKNEILSQKDLFEETVIDNVLFNPDRVYEFLVEPFSLIGRRVLDTLDGQTPLRFRDTVFLESV